MYNYDYRKHRLNTIQDLEDVKLGDILMERDTAALLGIKKCNVIIRNQEECIEVSYAGANLVSWAQPTPDHCITVLVQLPTGKLKCFTLFGVLQGRTDALPTLLLYNEPAAANIRAAPPVDPAALTDFLS